MLILLDRDGVLNRMCIDAEHGTIDSPLHRSQVEMLPGVPEALGTLTAAGCGLAIVSNQPAAAKGKTTRANLDDVHAEVLARASTHGGRILSSHLCFHRAEDGCDCRKPRPGLLLQAVARYPQYDRASAWMVGDGLTDLEAGARAGVQTAFLGPKKCDACRALTDRNVRPTAWVDDLLAFTRYVLGCGTQSHA